MSPDVQLWAQLQRVGEEVGLDALGVAGAEVFESTLADLRSRKDQGLHADMQFTYRNPERSTDPTRHLPDARSLVVGALSYLRDPDGAELEGPAGRVARYVWEDHYRDLRSKLGVVAGVLADAGWRTRILVDDNALVDREAAHRAGLGWYGKNANLLLPGRGSWFVLGSVLTDAPLPPATPMQDGCGTCTRCLTSCPTDAIVAPGTIDANRCLAWLVQAKGTFPAEYREALGDRIYGCDDCQEVCPPNRRQARQVVHLSSPARRPWVPLLEILAADDQTLLDRYGVWYIPGREARYLRRNAILALANTADGTDVAVRDAVRVALDSEDGMLRAHAVWAAKRLGCGDLLAAVAGDSEPDVVAELARDVSPAG
ncbi:MAG: tRNA epoxyqueuosine(34) reductase QueG [Actinomycetota bacterium]